uniref:Uncharacterized protein n=1 Tax=Anguilla anguilla TaxID=7936 RepID=A0A0E9QSK4_ANGAN
MNKTQSCHPLVNVTVRLRESITRGNALITSHHFNRTQTSFTFKCGSLKSFSARKTAFHPNKSK